MLLAVPAWALTGDAKRGEEVYEKCGACHSPDENRVGPMHKGVVGRKAGTVPDFDYSPELKASGITWTEANLEKWLTDPDTMVPGNKMGFHLEDPQERADVIAYLKTLK